MDRVKLIEFARDNGFKLLRKARGGDIYVDEHKQTICIASSSALSDPRALKNTYAEIRRAVSFRPDTRSPIQAEKERLLLKAKLREKKRNERKAARAELLRKIEVRRSLPEPVIDILTNPVLSDEQKVRMVLAYAQ